ncbi:hypothetical protein, partial [Pseudomonas aeruginosa]|uniref:hypothetical protein n=1 Tax=Pseudomonas aeruginosa TaxID=287 RepID=UPI001F418E04
YPEKVSKLLHSAMQKLAHFIEDPVRPWPQRGIHSFSRSYPAKSCTIFSVLPMRIASEFLASPNNALMEKSFKTSGTVLV